jgi:hypothetical protein
MPCNNNNNNNQEDHIAPILLPSQDEELLKNNITNIILFLSVMFTSNWQSSFRREDQNVQCY